MIPGDILDKNGESVLPAFRLAAVKTITADGVTVQFEGEDEASSKEYKVMQDYKPTVNDRVLVIKISGTSIVLGSFGAPTAPVEFIPTSEKGVAGGVATLNEDGRVVQKAVRAVSADSAANATDFAERHTGSYIAFFGKSTAVSRQSIATLSTSADLAAVVTKVNTIINTGKNYGLYG